MGTVKQNADIEFRSVSLIFTVNMYPTGGGNNNNNNNNNNNAVLVARGGWKVKIQQSTQRRSGTGEKETQYINVVGKTRMHMTINKLMILFA